MTVARTVENFRIQIDLAAGTAELVTANVTREDGVIVGTPEPIYPFKSAAPAVVQAQLDALIDAIIANQPPGSVPTQTELVSYAAYRRWRKETSGVSVDFGGALGAKPVMTDDRSKVMILGAASSAQQNVAYTTNWKFGDGTFATLDAAAIATMAGTVGAHVAACFAVEEDVVGQIMAGTIAAIAQIDAAFG